jgi:hypothetical protein
VIAQGWGREPEVLACCRTQSMWSIAPDVGRRAVGSVHEQTRPGCAKVVDRSILQHGGS